MTRGSFLGALTAFGRERRGAAAAELALVVGLLGFVLMNLVDIGVFVFTKMQVVTAAQQAAETIWLSCGSKGYTPVTTSTKCSTYDTLVTTSAQSTTLGTGVTASIPAETWECVNTSGALTSDGAITSSPSTCANGNAAGDYIEVVATYDYTPLFGGLSVVNLLGSADGAARKISSTIYFRVA
jgi:hypothetical protein